MVIQTFKDVNLMSRRNLRNNCCENDDRQNHCNDNNSTVISVVKKRLARINIVRNVRSVLQDHKALQAKQVLPDRRALQAEFLTMPTFTH